MTDPIEDHATAATLEDLERGLRALGFDCRVVNDAGVRLRGICDDSRGVGAGELFVALPGHRDDGARYARAALEAGAAAVACLPGREPPRAPALLVDELTRAAGHLAAMLLGEPARRLQLVGITGTNGKTSCAFLLESIWRAAGLPCGLAGTVCQRWPGEQRSAPMTTLPAVPLQRLLAQMTDAGCRAAVLEVSSHALAQHRVAGCRFAAGLFTNLTRDHLDYHGDEAAYFDAKSRLFHDYLDEGAVAVLNADDARVSGLRASLGRLECWSYSLGEDRSADARVLEADCGLGGTHARFDLRGRRIELRSPLVGRVNLGNLLAATTLACALGVDLAAIEEGLRRCPPVPGRLERVGNGKPVVLVDYAHTPDALERALEALRPLCARRLIVVFGCGGDRDRGKRSMMGEAAARGADLVVITSDNPRGEEPEAIIADIQPAVGALLSPASDLAADRGYVIEPNRERAIALAIAAAAPDDVLLVAGKGHEDYQEIAGVRRHFDDREAVTKILAQR